jgi:hypothetical protein
MSSEQTRRYGLASRLFFEPVQGLHRGVALSDAGIWFAAFLDCCKELAILQFDAVHGNIHL